MKTDTDPHEYVSCGKCQAVNTVPFGLDKFKCYNCNSLVAVARESSAACAAASATAMYYNEMETSSGPSHAGGNVGAAAQAATAPDKKKAVESVSFFGKLQQKMDNAMQKVDKTFMNLTTGTPSNTKTGPQPALVAPAPTVKPNAVQPPAPPALSSEEAQLQWALSASLETSQAAGAKQAAVPAHPAVMMGKPPTPPVAVAAVPAGAPGPQGGINARDQLPPAISQVAQKLHGSEERAARAEQDLAAAQTREAAAVAQREELKRQLDENEGLIKGLTEQIDTANAEIQTKTRQCNVLEQALVQAQQAAARAAEAVAKKDDGGMDDVERQGIVAQLLARITELEATLLRATHFAPEVEAADIEPDLPQEDVEVENQLDGILPPLPPPADPPPDLQYEEHEQTLSETVAAGDAPQSSAIDPIACDPPSGAASETLLDVVACAETSAVPVSGEIAPALTAELQAPSAGALQNPPDDAAGESSPALIAGGLAPSTAACQSPCDDAEGDGTAKDKNIGAPVVEPSVDPSASEDAHVTAGAGSTGVAMSPVSTAEGQPVATAAAVALPPVAATESQPAATRGTEKPSEEAASEES